MHSYLNSPRMRTNIHEFEEQMIEVIVIFVLICELSYLQIYENMPSEICF